MDHLGLGPLINRERSINSGAARDGLARLRQSTAKIDGRLRLDHSGRILSEFDHSQAGVSSPDWSSWP
jgi:hypothetical protein